MVQEQVVFKEQINYCEDLGDRFVTALQHKINGYKIGYVVFDDYSVKTSLKDLTRKGRTGGKFFSKGYKVEYGTKINDFSTFLSYNITKDNLTLYLASVAVKNRYCRSHTCQGFDKSAPVRS